MKAFLVLTVTLLLNLAFLGALIALSLYASDASTWTSLQNEGAISNPAALPEPQTKFPSQPAPNSH